MGDPDEKLRKRVQWLNTKGGFDNALAFDKVFEAAIGLEISKVMRVLKDVEEKKDQVKDATAYVTSALRKAGGGTLPALANLGGPGGLASLPMQGGASWTAPPPPLPVHPDPGSMMSSGFGGGGGGGDWMAGGGGGGGGPGQYEGLAEDEELRRRINWLNSQGGFGGAVSYEKIIEAARGLEYSRVGQLLSQLEEKRGEVKDPTAWVCHALRKAGGGTHAALAMSLPPMMNGYRAPPPALPPPPPVPSYAAGDRRGGGMHGGGGGCGGCGGFMGAPADNSPMPPYMDDAVAIEDEKLRKKIGWMNTQGGFDGAINYTKITEAARGLEYAEVMHVLQQLQDKPLGSIKDPTAWVCAALRKSGGGGAAVALALASLGAGAFAAPPPSAPGFGGYGGCAAPSFGGPAPMDVESDKKLRRRIGWLNQQGGFGNAINYQKVAEAALCTDLGTVMEVLKELEEKREQVKDPTAYATSAIRKKAAYGVRRTIMKKKP